MVYLMQRNNEPREHFHNDLEDFIPSICRRQCHSKRINLKMLFFSKMQEILL